MKNWLLAFVKLAHAAIKFESIAYGTRVFTGDSSRLFFFRPSTSVRKHQYEFTVGQDYTDVITYVDHIKLR